MGSTYTAGQGNYIDGAGTVLGIAGLSTASQAFDDQVIDDAPLLVGADRILVGTQDKIMAGRLYNQARTEATGDTDATVFVDNPHVGAFRPIVTPYLNNTSVFATGLMSITLVLPSPASLRSNGSCSLIPIALRGASITSPS